MLVEFTFNRNSLDIDASQVQERIKAKLASLPLAGRIEIQSVTVMSNWLVVLIDFPDATVSMQRTEHLFDTIGGAIIREFIAYGVRFRGFEIHGKGGTSLIFKEKTQP